MGQRTAKTYNMRNWRFERKPLVTLHSDEGLCHFTLWRWPLSLYILTKPFVTLHSDESPSHQTSVSHLVPFSSSLTLFTFLHIATRGRGMTWSACATLLFHDRHVIRSRNVDLLTPSPSRCHPICKSHSLLMSTQFYLLRSSRLRYGGVTMPWRLRRTITLIFYAFCWPHTGGKVKQMSPRPLR